MVGLKTGLGETGGDGMRLAEWSFEKPIESRWRNQVTGLSSVG